MAIFYLITGCKRLKYSLLLGTVICFFALPVLSAFGEDVRGLYQQFDKERRLVEKNMFAGKNDDAIAGLAKLRDILDRIQEAGSGSSAKLKSAEKKYSKLVKDLERKTGRDLGGGSATAGKSSAAKLPPKPEVKTMTAKPPVAPAPAAKADKLPSGVTSRIKKIDQALDKVNKNLDKNSVQRAEFEFKAVAKIRKEIQDRYGNQVPADHPEMVALNNRIAETESRLKQSAGEAAAAEATKAKAKADNQALVDAWDGKLAAYVTRENEKELNTKLWELKGDAADMNRKHYDEAVALIKEYETVEFPLGKSMDLQNTENKLRDVLKDLERSYARQEAEKGSEEWLKKLEPYVSSRGEKVLIASYSEDIKGVQKQKLIYDEASALFKQYQTVEFPKGKSERLQQVETELAKKLDEFPGVLKEIVDAQLGKAEAKLDQEINFLQSKTEWKNDSKKLPYYLSRGRIDDAQKLIDRAAALLPAGDPALAKLDAKLAELVKINDERHQIRAERTRMIPDRFDGSDKDGIKETAANLVQAKIQGIKILRRTGFE